MANYDSNYAIAQEISARIGTSPIPFDSVYSIALEIYNELGGEPAEFDSVYSILLGILPLVEGGVASKVIDDSVISSGKTWSSSKINSELGGKQNTLTAGSGIVISGDTISCNVEPGQSLVAGQNISIDSANTISADGYIYDAVKGSLKLYNVDYENSGVNSNIATGINSAAFGTDNEATQPNTFAIGQGSKATGECSFAEGGMTEASGVVSHAEGWKTISSGGYGSHTEGTWTVASGIASHAEGYGGSIYKNVASGNGSHVEGCGTTAQNQSEHAEGSNNLSHKASDTFGNAGNTLHSIGHSDLMNVKYNALEIMQNADMYVKGIGGYQGTNTKVQDNTIKPLQTVISDINTSVAGKQDTLTAGTNITISGTTISATYEVATTADIEALFS